MPPSKQDTKKITEWKTQNIERMLIESRKNRHVIERIKKAVDAGNARSRQEYVLNAVERALESDGFPCKDE